MTNQPTQQGKFTYPPEGPDVYNVVTPDIHQESLAVLTSIGLAATRGGRAPFALYSGDLAGTGRCDIRFGTGRYGMRKVRVTFTLLFVLGLLLAACGGTPAPQTPAEQPSAAAPAPAAAAPTAAAAQAP